jgi:hypothetical protein
VKIGGIIGIKGTASTGEDDGSGVGAETCFAVCFGADSDEGVSFGGGFAFVASINVD